MTNEIKCSVVRDLLPAYAENLTSEKTNVFIKEHLAECEACRAADRMMRGGRTQPEIKSAELVKRLLERKKRRRRRAVLLTGLAVLALAVCLLPMPKQIHSTFDALEWRLGGGEEVRREVAIDGVYMDYLFRRDHFDGKFTIEGYPETQLDQPRWEAYDDGVISMMSYIDENGMLTSVGMLLMDAKTPRFAVLVYETDIAMDEDGHVTKIEGQGWNGGNGKVISWPAGDRDQALETLKALAVEYSPNGLGASKLE